MRRCTIVGIVVVLTILVYKSLSVNANSEDHQHIPARARKAGASLKRKFLEINSQQILPDSQQTSQEPEAVPSVYTKQNGTGSFESESVGGEKEAESENEEEDYNYHSEEGESTEEECSEEMFWHVRGLRCVPWRCPGGNSKRDKDTGECLHLPYSNRKYRYGTRGNYIGRSGYTNSKTRLSFRIFRG